MKSPPLSWQSGNYLEECSSGAVVDGKEAASDENVNSNRLMLKMLKDCSNILRIEKFPKKDSRNLLCALVEEEDLRVPCLRKMLLEKCNVAPILSRLLTQQGGNVFLSHYSQIHIFISPFIFGFL